MVKFYLLGRIIDDKWQRKILYDGFKNITFKGDSLLKVVQVIKDLNNGNIKEGYSWQQKYRGTQDLRPDVFTYDTCFIDVLIENNILDIIKGLTCCDYDLYHVQIRHSNIKSNSIVNKNITSYMDWHRDCFIMGDKILGRFPPVIKLIFYPTLGSKEKDRLKIIPNSHLIQIHADQDFKSSYGPPINSIDRQLISQFKPAIIKSSDSRFLLFNTAMLHGAMPDLDDDKAFRIVYSFILKDQFLDEKKKIHIDTRDAFNKARKENENIH